MLRIRFALLALVLFTPALRADEPKVLTRIAFGSCADQDKPLPIFDTTSLHALAAVDFALGTAGATAAH